MASTQHHPAFRPASAFDTRRDETTTGCSDTLPQTPSPAPIPIRPSGRLADMGTRRTQLQMDPSTTGQHDRNAIGVPEPTGSRSVPVLGRTTTRTTFLYLYTWESVAPGLPSAATQPKSISSRPQDLSWYSRPAHTPRLVSHTAGAIHLVLHIGVLAAPGWP